jgi:hypothetical protein
MKKSCLKHLFTATFALAVVARAHADFEVTFDSPAASAEASGSVNWSTGPDGWSGAGCLQNTDSAGGWAQGSGVTINFSYASGHQPNLWAMDATAGHLSFDLIVDGTSFNANAQWWNFIIAANSPGGWAQTQVTNGWQNAGDTSLRVYHIDLPFSALNWTPAVAAGSGWYQVNLWAQSEDGNPVNYYVDNVSVYTATTVTPTNYLAKVTGPRGLTFVTSSNVFNYDVGNEQFQRQNVRTATLVPGWVGSSDPVTYALTITNFPGLDHTNFQAQLWLVDGVANANAPDYNNPAVVSLSISQNADGTANGHLAYKVNQPSGNSMFYAAGNLGDCTSATALGTWSLTFTNDDSVIVTSPSGNTLSTNLVEGDGAANFGDGLTAYIDAQSILVQNIGQQAVFSRFAITANNITQFSDDFSTTVIDASKWVSTQAEDPANVYQIPTTAAYKLSWTLPDGGFSLQASGDLAGWASPGLPTTTLGGQRTTFLSTASVSTNSAKFYRLIHP